MPVNQQSLSSREKFSASRPTGTRRPLYQHTSGDIVGETTSIDLVRDASSEKFRLSVFSHGKHTVVDRCNVGRRVFLPARIPAAFARQIRWPDRRGDFISIGKLASELRAILLTEGFAPETGAKAAYWVLASCFVDVLPAAPTLVISGPPPEASFLLRLLSCLVRRGLVIDGFKRNALRPLQMQLRPTLLINSGALDNASRRLILATSRPGTLVPCGDQLVDAYSAKAIYVGPIPELSICDALHIILQPSGRLPVLTQKRADEIAAEIQPKILAYRGHNIFTVCNSEFDASKIDANLRLMARIFAAPLVGARTLQEELLSLVQKSEQPFCKRAWTDMPSVLLEAAVQVAHLRLTERVAVGEFAEKANKLLATRGDKTEHSAREVGPILASFGLKIDQRSAANTILVDAAASKRVHFLASQSSVLNFAPKKRCTFCDELAVRKSN